MVRNSYLVFEKVNLTDVTYIEAGTATAYTDVTLDFWAGSPGGQFLGRLHIPVTD